MSQRARGALSRTAIATLAAVAAAAIACERPPEQPMTDTAPGEPAPAATPQPTPAQTMTDPEIMMVVMTANAADSATGELAQTRAESQPVRQFAERMVTDHGAANQQAAELSRRLNITPQESDLNRQLMESAQQARQQLSQQSGPAFDRAYMQHETQFHQTLLDTMDNTLLPNAQNPELRSYLEEVRQVLSSHLQQAQQIQGQLAMR